MKRLKFTAVLALTALLAVSCFTDVENELEGLERRLDNINKKVTVINENIVSLQTIADKYKAYVYIENYRPVYQGKDIIGYTINFTDGTSITLKNGVSKDDPIVGLQLGEDGLYYWTVTVGGKTDLLYDETGQPVAASVASPIMKIVDGVWQVSFDNGYVWQTFDKAQAADGTSFVDSIVTRNDFVYIYLVSGRTVSFPTYSLYEDLTGQLNALNANIEALKAIYEAKAANNFVQNVVPIVQDKDTVGYTILFNDNTSVTVYDGKPYDGQKIGIAQYTDENYYWAVIDGDKIEWLYDDLERMVQASPTEGQSPIFMLDDSFGDGKYYWAFKYGKSGIKQYLYDKNGKRVVATNSNVVQLFSDIDVTDKYVLFTPLAGASFYIPRYEAFRVRLSSTSVVLPAPSGPATVNYTVESVPATVAITALTEKGYSAVLTKTYDATAKKLTGSITITADITAAAKSTIVLLVSDGNGHTESYKIAVTKS